MVKGIVNSLSVQNGTKLFANNVLGEEYVLGEKVLVRFGADVSVYKDNASYYLEDLTYTGFATGNVDEEGKIEVKLLLPNEVNLTVITDIDVADDEIVFEGVR